MVKLVDLPAETNSGSFVFFLLFSFFLTMCVMLFLGLHLDRSGADGHLCPGLHARPQQGASTGPSHPILVLRPTSLGVMDVNDCKLMLIHVNPSKIFHVSHVSPMSAKFMNFMVFHKYIS